ncbi:hypothetical protein DB346_03030 [Verrucomicrobia bacterium LW23]|nr:hypothetical protein DB346_03625 [Verrucomicrobia bacterium LW23]PTY04423.1 hypothetical protein DB346_03030 [Verrucomicrobia bacterium LW23]
MFSTITVSASQIAHCDGDSGPSNGFSDSFVLTLADSGPINAQPVGTFSFLGLGCCGCPFIQIGGPTGIGGSYHKLIPPADNACHEAEIDGGSFGIDYMFVEVDPDEPRKCQIRVQISSLFVSHYSFEREFALPLGTGGATHTETFSPTVGYSGTLTITIT